VRSATDPTAILTRGIESGVHPGAQLFVRLGGENVIDFAGGEARIGSPMQHDSIVQWFSSGKPLTAILIAQFCERGVLALNDPVSRFVPKFAAGGKEAITVRHLLTHTAGLRAGDNFPHDLPWAEAIKHICQASLEADWIPGEKAGYSTQAAWFILAEIIQRITGIDFARYIKSELLDPLGMKDSWLRLPAEEYARYGRRMSVMYNTGGGKKDALPLQDSAGMQICRPGATARGPINELARFYEMLLNHGELEGHSFLKPETVDLFTRRERVGLYDDTFMHTLDYSPGFIINSNRYGAETVPYGYGRYASEATFGHSGVQSSCAFADPAQNLVAAWVTNGMPGERAHQQRQRELNSAIYQYVGLA
jgi:CubicO group peptidase (beta-lactamase class C family)